MADEKLSDLPIATTPNGSELIYLVQGGVSKQSTLNSFTPTLQQVLTAGSNLVGNNNINATGVSNLTFGSTVPFGLVNINTVNSLSFSSFSSGAHSHLFQISTAGINLLSDDDNGVSNNLWIYPSHCFTDNNFEAFAFIKTGGTSSQFLKADGSVDSSTYLTSASLTGYVPYTGASADLSLGANKFNVSGLVNIGNATSDVSGLSALRIGRGAGIIDIGERSTGNSSIWFSTSPTTSNFALGGSVTGATILNGAGTIGTIDIRSLGANVLVIKGAATTGSTNSYDFIGQSRTGQTATDTNTLKVTPGALQYTTGATIPIHREAYFRRNIITATSASQTITDIYNGFFEKNTVSTNVTNSSNWALGAESLRLVDTTTSLNIHGTTASDLSSQLVFTNSSTGSNIATDGTLMGLANGVDFYFLNREATGRVFFKVNGGDRIVSLPDGALWLGGTNTNGATGAGSTLLLDVNKNIICGTAAIATNATNGFFYAPTCAGVPTGVPTSIVGRTPMVWDSTNKRLYLYDGSWNAPKPIPRVTTITSSATPTINTDNCDNVTITALATNITSFTTNLSGTPVNFDKLTVRIKDDGTIRSLAWGALFVAKGTSLPTTTVANKLLTVIFIYDSVALSWGCVGSSQEI
jgi:hypothetical protein